MAQTVLPNYYDLLGVKATASADEIKTAYRRMAKMAHPDTSGGPTDALFALVQEAYSTLSSPLLRKEYDQKLAGASTTYTEDEEPTPPPRQEPRTEPVSRPRQQPQRRPEPTEYDEPADADYYEPARESRTVIEAIIHSIANVPGRVAARIAATAVLCFAAGRAPVSYSNGWPDTTHTIALLLCPTAVVLGWLVRAGARPISRIEHVLLALAVTALGNGPLIVIVPFVWPVLIGYSVWCVMLSQLPAPATRTTWGDWWPTHRGRRAGAVAFGVRRTLRVLTFGKVSA